MVLYSKMDFIKNIISEFGPCAPLEILDYIHSDFFYQKGYFTPQDWTLSKIKYHLEKIAKEDNEIFKFQTHSGYKIRYGHTKFEYYLSEEPRFLKAKGSLRRCIFCGMPVYVNENKEFHFKYKCEQYIPQEYFKLLKIHDKYAIISRDYIYGIIDNLQSCSIRLPGRNQNMQEENIHSELWLINEQARKLHVIEKDRLLPLKVEEFIVELVGTYKSK
ncbi:MAG: hypothetical protein ACTSWY_00770 [Promethearchaeota archaeon]